MHATVSPSAPQTARPSRGRSQTDVVTSSAARGWLAALRIVVGFIFLWAFLDKTFGFGYSTAPERAWIRGGSPAGGFLTHLEGGPFKDFFASLASPLSDWLFQLGMLGLGLALIAGIGLRVSAWAGTAIMLLMWLAEFPPAFPDSTNPVVDYHIAYALSIIISAVTLAGDTWGLGRWWRTLPIVQRWPWLI